MVGETADDNVVSFSLVSVTIIGGIVFLIFAVTALFFDPNEET